jgi:hypothetical protein
MPGNQNDEDLYDAFEGNRYELDGLLLFESVGASAVCGCGPAAGVEECGCHTQ